MKASTRPNHNIPSGHIEFCQVCGSGRLETVIDLGHQPLCDTLLSKSDLQKPEMSYPLHQVWCQDCTLSQLNYVVSGEVVYHQEYPYRTGVTKELAAYQDTMAESIVSDLKMPKGNFVVDIGSNDGTLLGGFKRRGMRTLGVEPTGIAKFAREDGIETLQNPFTEEVAKQIVETHGLADVVTATNVFAHMASLGRVIEGLEVLIKSDGFFVLENHYLGAIMKSYQFDTIYHEHLRSYSLRSLMVLFDFYDFTVVDAFKVDRYGGNIRVYVQRGKNRKPSARVNSILEEEKLAGFSNPEFYGQFRDASIRLKNELLSFVIDCKIKGKLVVGNSCPGRCSTLLNFAGIGPDLLPYICEQPASLKLGKYLPGMHIPIVPNERLQSEQPDFVVLLAWHYAQPIIKQLRERGVRSSLIQPMPEFQIFEN